MEHTATPWMSMPESGLIYITDGTRTLATVESLLDGVDNVARIAEKEANAAFIVTAVNAHDALVAQLKEIGTDAHSLKDSHHPNVKFADCPHWQCVNVRAALKLAEGEQVTA